MASSPMRLRNRRCFATETMVSAASAARSLPAQRNHTPRIVRMIRARGLRSSGIAASAEEFPGFTALMAPATILSGQRFVPGLRSERLTASTKAVRQQPGIWSSRWRVWDACVLRRSVTSVNWARGGTRTGGGLA